MPDVGDSIRKYLDPVLGSPKFFGKQLKYNCPSVGCDRGGKHNLEICVDENQPNKYLLFNCWSCNYHGWISKILYDYAVDQSWKNIPEFQSKNKISSVKKAKEKSLIELPNSIPYHNSEKVTEYLISERKMTHDFLHQRNVRYVFSKEDELYDKIIFPFYGDGKKLIGFCSQDFITKKYKNHGTLNFVRYSEFINPLFPITITEGIYDCGSVPNAIPLMGTKVYKQVLRFCQDKFIILALDNEVDEKEKIHIANEMISYGAKKVTIFNMNGFKDLNKYYTDSEPELKKVLLDTYKLLTDETK